MVTIPQTSLTVFPLCLGGNVFGWSADEAQSQPVLDGFVHGGGNFIDTADVYAEWKEGNHGGESESIIGAWAKNRGIRNSLVIATKVAKLSTRPGLSAKNIAAACDDSLRRLKSDHIDIYYAHEDDQKTPLGETLEAFTKLVDLGKVRYIASSNYSPDRMSEALTISQKNGFASYIGVQDWYNLLDRKKYEEGMAKVVAANNLASMPFFSLARGFLSGKYQPNKEVDSMRSSGVAIYQNDRGWETVSALREIARKYGCSVSAVALAWLRAQPSVSVPIASARTTEQLAEIMQVVELSAEEIAYLSEITA
jgi:aryl-alcohol dehydrogenase-like predicted oxidoreductase